MPRIIGGYTHYNNDNRCIIRIYKVSKMDFVAKRTDYHQSVKVTNRCNVFICCFKLRYNTLYKSINGKIVGEGVKVEKGDVSEAAIRIMIESEPFLYNAFYKKY